MIKVKCYTQRVALWECPYCKFPNQHIVSDSSNKQKVDCCNCNRKVIISEE